MREHTILRAETAQQALAWIDANNDWIYNAADGLIVLTMIDSSLQVPEALWRELGALTESCIFDPEDDRVLRPNAAGRALLQTPKPLGVCTHDNVERTVVEGHAALHCTHCGVVRRM